MLTTQIAPTVHMLIFLINPYNPHVNNPYCPHVNNSFNHHIKILSNLQNPYVNIYYNIYNCHASNYYTPYTNNPHGRNVNNHK